MYEENKRRINMLMNIDNYFGSHDGKKSPMLIFLFASAAPFLFYVFFLNAIVPLKFMLVFEVLWVLFMALMILGKTPQKVREHRKERENVYSTSEQLIRVSNVTDDGLIEYSNGTIAYIVSGYTLDFVDDDAFTIAMEKFLRQLRGYDYDILSHMVIDEYKLQNNFEGLTSYANTEAISERIQFYQDQDEYCSQSTEAFRISIVVKASKYDWKTLKLKLDNLVKSEIAYCWKELKVCDANEANDVLSRDLCMDINIVNMLVEKYKNDEFFGSQVLFYGDEVPDEFKAKRDVTGMENRRVIDYS